MSDKNEEETEWTIIRKKNGRRWVALSHIYEIKISADSLAEIQEIMVIMLSMIKNEEKEEALLETTETHQTMHQNVEP